MLSLKIENQFQAADLSAVAPTASRLLGLLLILYSAELLRVFRLGSENFGFIAWA